jgi:hypothetical protein
MRSTIILMTVLVVIATIFNVLSIRRYLNRRNK